MPAKDINTSTPGLDVKEILRELEVPFSPDQVQWRVTVTANDRKRGQIVPYARSSRLHRSAGRAGLSSGLDARVQDRDHEQHHPHQEGRKLSLGQSVCHLHGHYFRPVVALGNG